LARSEVERSGCVLKAAGETEAELAAAGGGEAELHFDGVAVSSVDTRPIKPDALALFEGDAGALSAEGQAGSVLWEFVPA